MSDRVISRPGGRSARIQAAVHDAVKELLDEVGRDELSMPMIASRAGVTPSTLYRRWGDLPDLLADVTSKRLRPDLGCVDTGSLQGDIQAWMEGYAEEMSSRPGRQMLRDVIAASEESGLTGRCCQYASDQLEVLFDRARSRGEIPPEMDTVLELLLAPILYRILFDGRPADREFLARLLQRVF